MLLTAKSLAWRADFEQEFAEETEFDRNGVLNEGKTARWRAVAWWGNVQYKKTYCFLSLLPQLSPVL